MTGWRLGYSVWPKPWREVARKLAVNSYSCVNSAAQFAGIAALEGPQDLVEAMRAEFDRRRKAVVAGLNRLPGVSAVTPKGAFYAFPNIARTGWKAKPLASALLEEAGVATDRRPRFRRIRRGLPAPLLRQLAREHRTRARADGRVSRPPRFGQRERIGIVFGGSVGPCDLFFSRPPWLSGRGRTPAAADGRRGRRHRPATPPSSARATSPNACAPPPTRPTGTFRRRSRRPIKSIDSAPGTAVVAEGALAPSARRGAGAMGELARLGVPGRRPVRGRHDGQGRRPAAQLHHRQRRRADREPQGALSVSRGQKGR